MKLFNKSNKENNETHRLPMGNKSKRVLATCAVLVLMSGCFITTAFATSDLLMVINNLSEFTLGLVRAVDMILLGFDIVQAGLSLKSYNLNQRANGFLTLADDVIITSAKEILTLITG